MDNENGNEKEEEKRLTMNKLLLILVCSFTFFACQKEQQKTIILSKASLNYIKWMEDDNTIILDAYTIKNTDSLLAI